MFRKNVVDFLRVKVGLGERFSEEEVFRVIGILRTNAFFVEDERLKRCQKYLKRISKKKKQTVF